MSFILLYNPFGVNMVHRLQTNETFILLSTSLAASSLIPAHVRWYFLLHIPSHTTNWESMISPPHLPHSL